MVIQKKSHSCLICPRNSRSRFYVTSDWNVNSKPLTPQATPRCRSATTKLPFHRLEYKGRVSRGSKKGRSNLKWKEIERRGNKTKWQRGNGSIWTPDKNAKFILFHTFFSCIIFGLVSAQTKPGSVADGWQCNFALVDWQFTNILYSGTPSTMIIMSTSRWYRSHLTSTESVACGVEPSTPLK